MSTFYHKRHVILRMGIVEFPVKNNAKNGGGNRGVALTYQLPLQLSG
jgi:hypothetical protein